MEPDATQQDITSPDAPLTLCAAADALEHEARVIRDEYTRQHDVVLSTTISKLMRAATALRRVANAPPEARAAEVRAQVGPMILDDLVLSAEAHQLSPLWQTHSDVDHAMRLRYERELRRAYALVAPYAAAHDPEERKE